MKPRVNLDQAADAVALVVSFLNDREPAPGRHRHNVAVARELLSFVRWAMKRSRTHGNQDAIMATVVASFQTDDAKDVLDNLGAWVPVALKDLRRLVKSAKASVMALPQTSRFKRAK